MQNFVQFSFMFLVIFIGQPPILSTRMLVIFKPNPLLFLDSPAICRNYEVRSFQDSAYPLLHMSIWMNSLLLLVILSAVIFRNPYWVWERILLVRSTRIYLSLLSSETILKSEYSYSIYSVLRSIFLIFALNDKNYMISFIKAFISISSQFIFN